MAGMEAPSLNGRSNTWGFPTHNHTNDRLGGGPRASGAAEIKKNVGVPTPGAAISA